MQEEVLQHIPLWPAQAPGSAHLTFPERVVERSTEVGVRDRAVTGVTAPDMTVFRPERPNGTAILVAPGGGYQRMVIDKEGVEIAQWLNALGITVFVLKYRLPGEGHEQAQQVSLQDAQRAVRLIRARADEFGVMPWHIGVMGFSAGGHVIARVATEFNAHVYSPVDDADALSARPDFAVLAYPVITMDAAFAHSGSRATLLGNEPDEAAVAHFSAENNVSVETPPTFILLADDDPTVPAENAAHFYLALRRVGVSAELHSFQHGLHGFGVRHADQPEGAWMQLFEAWARANGWL
jgi:acetyl esterase/lipase